MFECSTICVICSINVNVHVYRQISTWIQQTVQFTPLLLEHTFYSLISSGKNSAFGNFAAAAANHYNLAFLFHQVPYHCWVRRGSVDWEVCPTLLNMTSNFNRTQDFLILSPTPYQLGHMPQERIPYIVSHYRQAVASLITVTSCRMFIIRSCVFIRLYILERAHFLCGMYTNGNIRANLGKVLINLVLT